MSEHEWGQIIAAIVGVAFVVVGRLVDRWLPDPEGKHPLPDPPATSPDVTPKHLVDPATSYDDTGDAGGS